jgi:hypothetical protein
VAETFFFHLFNNVLRVELERPIGAQWISIDGLPNVMSCRFDAALIL